MRPSRRATLSDVTFERAVTEPPASYQDSFWALVFKELRARKPAPRGVSVSGTSPAALTV